jgi:putative ABC transport system ATP-binding protein
VSGTTPPIVSLRRVTRTVRIADSKELHVLRGIDLDIHRSDSLSIVGRSGSGKSTLLNLLGLLDLPTEGGLFFKGTDVRTISGNDRARLRGASVGFIFQQFNLLPGRTALDNVMTPLLYAEGRQFWKRERLASAMLERVGLADRMRELPSNLSGGEQQRVAIARALVRRPELILADEPTGALDLETGAAVMELLDEISAESGAALVTITHDANVAQRASSHYRLDAGVLRTERAAA